MKTFKVTEKTIDEHWNNFNRGQLYSKSFIEEQKIKGHRLLSIELIGEEVNVLLWTDKTDISDIRESILVHYHSDNMFIKWLNRSSVNVSEVNYANYTN